MRLAPRDLAYTALGAVLLAVCAWITVPAPVPFTMQTFALFCVLELLGGRRGTLAVLVYLLLGAVGLPVFSGFRGGLGALLGPTGGYLLGFVLTGLVYWLFGRFSRKSAARVLSLALGLVLCYAFGTAWFTAVYARSGGAVSLAAALGWCVLPFLLPDAAKLALALFLSRRLRPLLRLGA